jgi:hypothetical protein
MINRPRRPDGPVDASNRHLSLLMAGMSAPPPQGPKRGPLPWGLFFTSAAVFTAVAWAAYWTLVR